MMSYYLTKYEVQTINQNHKHYTDVYARGKPYTVGTIIYSHLTEVKNSTLFLEIYINNDWKKNSQKTVILFINEWLNKYEELNQSKFYEVSIYKTKAKFPIHRDDEFNKVSKKIRDQYKSLKTKSTLEGVFTNIEPIIVSHWYKKTFKPYPFKATIYKLQVDLDLQFYSLNLNSFLRLFTYEWEEYYYSEKYAGIPTVLKVEKQGNNGFDEFPKIDFSKLSKCSEYAIMTYKQIGLSYNTKATLNIREVELDSIEIYKITRFRTNKLIAKAGKKKLKEIDF